MPRIPAKFDRALALRRSGAGYADILREVRVAKSTLWRWLKAEGLVETQPQRLTELRRAAQRKAAIVVRARRLARTAKIIEQARQEIGPLTHRDLWLLGLALYWAEGAKQKPGNVSTGVIFVNSDPGTVRLFIRWLHECCDVSPDRYWFEIYLHETASAERTQAYWASQLQLPIEQFARIRWKRHRPATRRTNVGDSYHGLIRVRVACSSALNRKITGWIVGVDDAVGSGAMAAHLALDQKIPGSNPGSPAYSGESQVQDHDDINGYMALEEVNP